MPVSSDIAPRIDHRIQLISPDPDLDADPTRRLPNAAQARFIRARDQHCVHPGCRATRTEDDHTIAHADGGPTHASNLKCLCRHHYLFAKLPTRLYRGQHGKDSALSPAIA